MRRLREIRDVFGCGWLAAVLILALWLRRGR